jgi:hypothetical protein
MSASGPLFLLAGIFIGILSGVFAHYTGLTDRLAKALEGTRQPAPRWPGDRSHVHVYRNNATRVLPRGDCGLKDWRGGDPAA